MRKKKNIYSYPLEIKKEFVFIMDGRKIDVEIILLELTYDLNTFTEIICVEVQTK